MRAFEFLNEASVFKTVNSQYIPGRRLSISTGADGKKTLAAISAKLPDFQPSEELTIVDQSQPSDVQIPLSKNIVKAFKVKRSNGTVIELQGSASTIESSLNDLGGAVDPSKPQAAKMPNKGDTAEALLGAAMFAKLQKRSGDSVGAVTTADIWTVFDKLKPVSNDDFMVTAKDLGGATDKIWFKLKLKNTVKLALSNPDMRKKLDSWAASPVNYVNSKEGTEYANEFYKNGEPDEVGIISDGLSEQTARKSDVYTVVRDPVTGAVQKEMLPISLKAGAEQFAQHSGSKFKSMSDMFGKLGLDVSAMENRYDAMITADKKLEAASMVYEYAAGQINSKINSNADEAQFIEQLAKALRFWATGDKDNIRLVSFGSKGQFDVLTFDNLIPKMKLIKLTAEFIPGDNPRIIVKDQEKGILFQMRTYLQSQKTGTYQRNVIEKGPLLSKIANALE